MVPGEPRERKRNLPSPLSPGRRGKYNYSVYDYLAVVIISVLLVNTFEARGQ